ncbi:MAG: RNA polymerase subunit sigma, partial [Lachnospiraceae bacterium]|nr:RNA polymerase subunit sigma [Lachnospiraceae bacterium]
GFRTKEIARLLGMSDAAVRTRLSRAREQLRKYYEEA